MTYHFKGREKKNPLQNYTVPFGRCCTLTRCVYIYVHGCFVQFGYCPIRFDTLSVTMSSARCFRKREQINISNQSTVLYLRSDQWPSITKLLNWSSETYCPSSLIICTSTMLSKLNLTHPHIQVPYSRQFILNFISLHFCKPRPADLPVTLLPYLHKLFRDKKYPQVEGQLQLLNLSEKSTSNHYKKYRQLGSLNNFEALHSQL